ncbi:MAG TPA: phosphatase PAP2 family protein [Actinomycetota bacterium]
MRRRWLSSSAAVAGALAVAAFAGTRRGRELDRRLFDAVNRGHGRGADAFFVSVTELGSIAASAAAAAVVAAGGRRRAALDGIGAASAMWVLGQALKQVYDRPRPYELESGGSRLLIGRPNGTSWPSSHPAVLLAFVLTCGRGLGLGPGARTALVAVAGTVAVSRVYVGVHFPSDVVGGVLLGRAVAGAWPTPAQGLQ